MADAWVTQNSNDRGEMKWRPMLVLSVLLHISIFFVILLVPESIPTRRVEGVVYEVKLVEMPAQEDLDLQRKSPGKAGKRQISVKRPTKAKRIKSPTKKEKPIVIAKRKAKVKKKDRQPPSDPKISAEKLIEQEISRIKTKVQSESEDRAHLDKTISKLKEEVNSRSQPEPPGGPPPSGISIRIYQAEVETKIKGNWSYPVALQLKKDLEAIVVLQVKSDGTILRSQLKKRSANPIFDQSVLKAIEKSDPLPPFPEGYRKSHDEIEITFNLKDLEGS
jgi:colicin import membrane protein